MSNKNDQNLTNKQRQEQRIQAAREAAKLRQAEVEAEKAKLAEESEKAQEEAPQAEVTNTDVSSTDVAEEAPVKGVDEQSTAEVKEKTNSLARKIEEIQEKVEVNAAASVVAQLEEYVAAMGKECMYTREEGFRKQKQLLSIYRTVLRTPDSDFKAVFNAVLKIVNENLKGAFAANKIFRFLVAEKSNFSETQKVFNKKDYYFFVDFTTFLTAIANPATRSVNLKQAISLPKLLKSGVLTETEYNKINAFLNGQL